MKIALGQIDVEWENKKANERKCSDFIKSAKKQQAEIVIFPEMTLTGFSMNSQNIKEKKDISDSIKYFKEEAIKNNIIVAFGMVADKRGKYYNTFIVINEKGEVISSYDKIHPFSYVGEAKSISGGERLAFFKHKHMMFSTFICYDLRFPEPFIKASYSSEAIIVIANWPKSRIEQWEILLKARAIETQSYIIAVNRVGQGEAIEYNGHSIVVNPYGDIVSKTSEVEEVIICDIHKKEVTKYRNDFPYKSDRKDMIYKYL